MGQVASAALLTIVLFVGMLISIEIGWRLGSRRAPAADAGTSSIEGALFALLGLLIAFTFSGASSRLDARRQLIVSEANDIGTAWLRLALLPDAIQPPIRDRVRQYVDERLIAQKQRPGSAAMNESVARCNQLQTEIWDASVAGVKDAKAAPGAPILLLPALNQMFDTGATRIQATQTHPPLIVFAMLFVLALMTSLLAGFAMGADKQRKRLHAVAYAAILSATFYVIVDIEYPRQGLVRLDSFDQAIIDVRASLK